MKLPLFFLSFVLCILVASCAVQTKEDRVAYVQNAVRDGLKLTPEEQGNIAVSYLAAVKYMTEKKGKAHPHAAHFLPPEAPKLKRQARLKRQPKSNLGSIRFSQEVVRAVFALVPYKMSMWAVTEVFPNLSMDHPDIQAIREHPNVKSFMDHSFVQKVSGFVTSNFVFNSIVILIIFGAFRFGVTAHMLHGLRRFVLAVCFGLLIAALFDLLLYFISTFAKDEHLERLAYAGKIIESILFFLGFGVSMWMGFYKQFFSAILGSIAIFIINHFFEDGVFHTDVYRSLTQSDAVNELKSYKEAAAAAAQTGKDWVTKKVSGETSQQPPAEPKKETGTN